MNLKNIKKSPKINLKNSKNRARLSMMISITKLRPWVIVGV